MRAHYGRRAVLAFLALLTTSGCGTDDLPTGRSSAERDSLPILSGDVLREPDDICRTCEFKDSDGDGLDDMKERFFIKAYRPIFAFHDDGLYPMSISEFMKFGGSVINYCRGLTFSFSNINSFNSQLTNPYFNESICSRINSNNVVGADPYENAPYYGDATPYRSTSGQQLVWIQYWVFWGFNQVPSGCPNAFHEGDWEWVDWLVPASPIPTSEEAWYTSIKAFHFHAHGDIDIQTNPSM